MFLHNYTIDIFHKVLNRQCFSCVRLCYRKTIAFAPCRDDITLDISRYSTEISSPPASIFSSKFSSTELYLMTILFQRYSNFSCIQMKILAGTPKSAVTQDISPYPNPWCSKATSVNFCIKALITSFPLVDDFQNEQSPISF